MKILICGAGSIGVYLGVMLNAKGHDVLLFGRKKLKDAGERVFVNGEKFAVPKRIFRMPAGEKYDIVFITSKLYDLEKILNEIKKSRTKFSLLAGIQNGLVDASEYGGFGKKLVPVCVFSGFNLSGNKLAVNSTSVGWRTEDSEKGRRISRIISDAGIRCTSDRNFDSIRAEKMIVNCCLNVLSAVENKPFSMLFRNKKTRERINQLFHECYSVLSKKYRFDAEQKMKSRMYRHWSGSGHYSSTHQDIASGRKSEADFFNGYIVRMAKKYNLSSDENASLLADLGKTKR